MSKFCTSCGEGLSSENLHCPNCGAKVSNVDLNGGGSVSNSNSKLIGIGAVAIVAIILLSIIFSTIFNKGYEAPLKHLVNGINKSSSETFLKAFPKELSGLMAIGINDDTMEDMKEQLIDEYGKNVKASYKVTKKKKISKSKLKDLNKSLLFDVSKPTAGYDLTFDLKIKGRDGKDVNEDIEISVYKLDGKWVFLDMGAADFDL